MGCKLVYSTATQNNLLVMYHNTLNNLLNGESMISTGTNISIGTSSGNYLCSMNKLSENKMVFSVSDIDSCPIVLVTYRSSGSTNAFLFNVNTRKIISVGTYGNITVCRDYVAYYNISNKAIYFTDISLSSAMQSVAIQNGDYLYIVGSYENRVYMAAYQGGYKTGCPAFGYFDIATKTYTNIFSDVSYLYDIICYDNVYIYIGLVNKSSNRYHSKIFRFNKQTLANNYNDAISSNILNNIIYANERTGVYLGSYDGIVYTNSYSVSGSYRSPDMCFSLNTLDAYETNLNVLYLGSMKKTGAMMIYHGLNILRNIPLFYLGQLVEQYNDKRFEVYDIRNQKQSLVVGVSNCYLPSGYAESVASNKKFMIGIDLGNTSPDELKYKYVYNTTLYSDEIHNLFGIEEES